MKQETIIIPQVQLAHGGTLLQAPVAYQLWGNPQQQPVVWVCHALTGNADVEAWWPGMVGAGPSFPIDTTRWAVVCANVPGSCYGTVGPLSTNPATGQPYYHSFPQLVAADVVPFFEAVRQHLGIGHIHLLVGASLGGQHALQWALHSPQLCARLLLLATNAQHSPWGIAWNEAQRMAIEADPTWPSPSATAGLQGMMAARAMALLSYRNAQAYNSTQPRSSTQPQPAASYQRYQGAKLARRFNAFSYYRLSQMMDSHDLAQHQPSLAHALASIAAQAMVVSISSDLLFPPAEQQLLARHLPQASYHQIDSAYGHDGFLVETQAIGQLMRQALQHRMEPVG